MDESLESYLKELLCLVEKYHLAEISIEGPDQKIKLKTAEALTNSAPAANYAPVPAAAPLIPTIADPPPPCRENLANPHRLYELRCPLLGVFYRAASPDTPMFVQEGDYVTAGQVVCLIEAMKVFNEITAERSGRVVEICAANGSIVESDQVLMLLDLAAKPEE